MIIQPTQEQTRRVLRKRKYSGPGFGPRSFECMGMGLGLGLGLGFASNGQAPDVNFTQLGAAFWLDAARPASYTATGTTLTSLINLVNSTAISTITGTPKIVTSPRDGKPAFDFAGASAPAYVRGTDATAQAAVAGTNKALTVFFVVNVADAFANGMFMSITNNASSTVGFEVGQLNTSPGYWTVDYQGASGYKAATNVKALAGTVVGYHRTLDGLTWFTSINGGAETSVTLTSAGAITANQVCIGAAGHTTPTLPFGGYIHEIALFASGLSQAVCAAISATLRSKWGRQVQVMFHGDSLTTAHLSSNGGMLVLLQAAVRAAGGRVDMTGPIAQQNSNTGEVWYPHRYSAASGNTSTQMKTRIESATQGVGSAAGHYLNTDLHILLAGTNMETDAATSLAAYSALLDSLYTRAAQGNKPPRILVSRTITEITTNLTYSQDVNAGRPAIHSAFDAAHPGVLSYWDANLSNPNDGSSTYYVGDGTHWNNAGYVRACNDPTNGLIQAALPIIMSLQ